MQVLRWGGVGSLCGRVGDAGAGRAKRRARGGAVDDVGRRVVCGVLPICGAPGGPVDARAALAAAAAGAPDRGVSRRVGRAPRQPVHCRHRRSLHPLYPRYAHTHTNIQWLHGWASCPFTWAQRGCTHTRSVWGG
jgi:hypothetical protein